MEDDTDLKLLESQVLDFLNKGRDLHEHIKITLTDDIGYAYLFYYQSEKYLETQNFLDQILGNGPVVVIKIDGKMYTTGTANPLEYYLKPIKEKYGIS